MIKVLLDGVEISNQTEVDASFVEKLDRELDEGFVSIAHTDRKEQFPMFSTIDILEDNVLIFSGRVSGDMVDLSSFSSELYNHKLTIIEHTKLLEKYLVNGKTFTQPVGDVGVPLYTLFDVVDILRTTALFEKKGLETVFAPFTIPQEVEDELDAIVAPEFSFKDVTLRQALDEVANVVDSITRLTRDNEIVFDKFNELNQQINFVTENYKKQQNIDAYSTILSSDVLNPVSQGKDNLRETEVYPGKTLWTTLRSDFGRFDFENSYIPTPKPIYEVTNTKTVVSLNIEEFEENPQGPEPPPTEIFSSSRFELDISNNIVEKRTYDTLRERMFLDGIFSPNGITLLTQIPTTLFGFYDGIDKRTVIFYEYGKRNIKIGKTYGIFDIGIAFDRLIENALFPIIKEKVNDETIHFDSFELEPIFAYIFRSRTTNKTYRVNYAKLGSLDDIISFSRWKALFRIEYVPIPPSIRYEVVRDDITEVDFYTNQTVNQKLRIVDLEAFTNNMKGRINQLAEGQLTLSHKVKKIANSFSLGNFTPDRFVITKKEVIIQRDHYIINYELNKNFNKISQFVGIDQEIRQWEIGEAGRSLDRDLNYNEYIEIYADDSGSYSQLNNDTTISSPELFLSTFNSQAQFTPISLATFSSADLLFEDGSPVTINLPFYRVSGGDSFGIYVDFETNASAGNELRQGDASPVVNMLDQALSFLKLAERVPRYFNIPVKYTDDIGRLNNFNISLYDTNLGIAVGDFDRAADLANLLPVITTPITQSPVISGVFSVKKDNRERLKMTLQYHLVSQNIDEVIVGNKLSTHNFLMIEEANDLQLRTFTNRTFTKRDKGVKLNNFEDKYTSNFLTIDNSNSYIEITKDLTNVDAWAITDEDGLPFLMVNGNKKRVIFELKNKRSNIRYLRTGFENRFKPPILVSSSSTEDSITMTLKNPNDEEVIVESFLSSRIPNGVQMSTVQPNQNVTFVFDTLESNRDYTFRTACVNLTTSLNQNKQNSIRRSFVLQTDPIPLDPPVFSFERFVRILPENFDDGRDLQVLFEITNTNDIPLRLESDTEGQINQPFKVIENASAIDGLEVVRDDLGGLSYEVEPDETILVLSASAFKSGSGEQFQFPEDIKFRWKTFQFDRNFFSEFSNSLTINAIPFDQPIYVEDGFDAPVITTNSIQVRWDNPNSSSAVISVEIYSLNSGFRIETKTATVQADSNVDILFENLQQSRTFFFRAKFLESFGKLESRQVGNPLFTPADEVITVTTFDDFGAAPAITRVAATTNSLTIRYTNQDTRDVIVSGGFSGSQLEQLGELQGSGDFIEETYTGLRAGEKYTFAARVRLVDEVIQAPEEQTTLFETFTRPAKPTVDVIQVTSTGYAARAFNTGNAYPVEIKRDGNLLTPSPTDPGHLFLDLMD